MGKAARLKRERKHASPFDPKLMEAWNRGFYAGSKQQKETDIEQVMKWLVSSWIFSGGIGMSDKERLEYIEEQVQELLTLADSEGCGEANLLAIYNDMIWLIEQAEKVEQLEERIAEGVKSHWGCAPCLAYDKLQAKVERYEKALENILISPFPLDIDDAVAIAKQALEGEK